jgi:hypothetical protein
VGGESRCVPLVCPAGSLVWASDPARLAGSNPVTWAELDPPPKRVRLFFRVVLLFYFLFVKIKIWY